MKLISTIKMAGYTVEVPIQIDYLRIIFKDSKQSKQFINKFDGAINFGDNKFYIYINDNVSDILVINSSEDNFKLLLKIVKDYLKDTNSINTDKFELGTTDNNIYLTIDTRTAGNK